LEGWKNLANEIRFLDSDYTDAAINNPQPGDIFRADGILWIIVIARNGDMITITQASAPCHFPEDGHFKVERLEEFESKYSLLNLHTRRFELYKRGFEISGWLEYYKARSNLKSRLFVTEDKQQEWIIK
jgi:hypothetical protein